MIIPDDASAASWIQPNLDSNIGSVGSIVPTDYDGYVRIFHPATSPTGSATSWEDVAKRTQRTMHALAQWDALVSVRVVNDQLRSEWNGGVPQLGSLPYEVWKPLEHVLRTVTSTEECYCGIWTGWADLSTLVPQASAGLGSGSAKASSVGPFFSLPPLAGRDYLLVRAPLNRLTRIWEKTENEIPFPNIVWPVDRSWFMGTDVDLDSTVLGGETSLVQAIVENEQLEAWRVGCADSLAFDADVINGD